LLQGHPVLGASHGSHDQTDARPEGRGSTADRQSVILTSREPPAKLGPLVPRRTPVRLIRRPRAMKCPRCQHENPGDAAFCQECGARLEAACPSCGTPNQLGAKFCKKCGQRLSRPEAAQAVPGPRFGSPESYTPQHLAEKILTSKSALEGERKL